MLAADQFIITPAGRTEEAARAHASGDEVRTVIAGYHWFTDWGRDTMISLEGLTLVTGRHQEAGYILRTFAHYVRDGLIPNMFPEGEKEGLYHTADATLWFFHAIARYLECSGRLRLTLSLLYPTAQDHRRRSRARHAVRDPRRSARRAARPGRGRLSTDVDGREGRRLGRHAAPRQGRRDQRALVQRAVSDGVVGAGAEGSGRCGVSRARRAGAAFVQPALLVRRRAVTCTTSSTPCKAATIRACRPNQIFAISLPHPVLARERWEPVTRVVRDRLLTPVGLRSLAPDDPDYKPRYFGDLRARDAAYHQGTVWAWLVGPFVDAWLKVYPDDDAVARGVLNSVVPHLNDACIGSISEIFDAEAPYTARGCIAQAWSVAEVLRAWAKIGIHLATPLTEGEEHGKGR